MTVVLVINSHREVTEECRSTSYYAENDPLWTLGCWRGQDDSIDLEAENIDDKQTDVITKYNQAMEC